MKTIVMTMVVMMAASHVLAAGVTDHIKKHRNLNAAADVSSEIIRAGSNKAYAGIKNYHVRNKADRDRADQYANVQTKAAVSRAQKRRP